MLDRKRREQLDLFVAGSLDQLIPKDHILYRVNRVLDLSWLREEVAECYCADNRPGLDPEVVVRMLAGLLLGYVHDRRLLREAQVNLASLSYGPCRGSFEPDADPSAVGGRALQGDIPAHGEGLFGREGGEGPVHVDASLIRADVSWASLAERHASEVVRENDSEEETEKKGRGGGGSVSRTDPDARLARKSARGGFEPSYKHHAVVDDERGVVLDVAVTAGTVNERAMMESRGMRGIGLPARDGDGGFGLRVLGSLRGFGAAAALIGEEGTLPEPCSVAAVPRRAPRLGEVSARQEAARRAARQGGALLSFECGAIARAARSGRIVCLEEQGGVDSARLPGAVARASAPRAPGGGGARLWQKPTHDAPKAHGEAKSWHPWRGRCAADWTTCGSSPT